MPLLSNTARRLRTVVTTAMLSTTTIRVVDEPSEEKKGRPAHWTSDKPVWFQNPWPSWRTNGRLDALSMLAYMTRNRPELPKVGIPIRTPTWGGEEEEHKGEVKATWLGHACFLVELPFVASLGRGARVLFDPVFSDRCSPSQYFGPKRYSEPPCKIEDIPEVDAVVISHNHYDHLDTHTITTLFKRPRQPHIFAPLGNEKYFDSIGIPKGHAHTLDWWDARRVEIPDTSFKLTCTPAQHFTGRGIHDQGKTLWASWVAEGEGGKKVYFAGDTGYRSVKDGEAEEERPTCPVFKEIGERFGGFDLAMIPIGAYEPRWFMSTIHCAPQDSVRIFKDVKAKKAVAMHWGTWILTTEEVTEPPKRLAEECKKIGIEEGDFLVSDIGETKYF
ncbi:N-acyl-phosphatidylethanolamine-hydrolyzing phospholipase D [Desarmillaria tabescens]|uniref:N-acyl-phosphatidylethanolamine-hydrolyzing phospholipase D n=1 Tax=Armillaria tabescens TaxID=1929756 RepID=A0AA39MZA7_ARMTA|nr:N-acyl-phosphatidylethanolamine-hydrolyzing phospholipase D [Desarmillaria tabescens]KAK0452177.1 N-acyl-phosphatidylethanolamine-hydrolyzing phospholipase D [Desarmillaria tabescens]